MQPENNTLNEGENRHLDAYDEAAEFLDKLISEAPKDPFYHRLEFVSNDPNDRSAVVKVLQCLIIKLVQKYGKNEPSQLTEEEIKLTKRYFQSIGYDAD